MEKEISVNLAQTQGTFLTSVRGISIILAAGVTSELGKPDEQKPVNNLVSDASIIPRVKQTGGSEGKTYTFSVAKRCNRILKDNVVKSALKLGLYGPEDLMADYKRREASGQTCRLRHRPSVSSDGNELDACISSLFAASAIVGKFAEYKAIRKDGMEFPIELSVSATQIKGKWNAIGIIRDISERKKSEELLNRGIEMLRKALGGIIQAMVLTLETRDPYTAGRQRRVSNIARSIATEMGLSEDKIDCIRTAGIIHDLGKISVPAEILSKPGRISKNEFGIIKNHSQIGYDKLKEVEFSWPICQVILQHHEKANDSGYL
ncbi:HD domain-containing phosphohydrolase [Thermodesulfobacteriota bacterium]